jgi:hypothetical protein
MTDTDLRADSARSERRDFVRVGVVTLAVVALAFAAFDDITTDNATRFPLEYSMLSAGGAWCLIVIVRLARASHRALAVVSLIVLGAAVWGAPALGDRTLSGLAPRYLATLAGLTWFFALAVVLILSGLRGSRPRSAAAAPRL